MKNNFFLLVISIFFVSCSKFPQQEFDRSNLRAPITTWQGQLEYAKKNNINTKTGITDRCCLLRYTYKGAINSETELSTIIEELFSDNSVTVWYSGNSNFEIIPLKTIRQKVKTLGIDDPLVDLKSQIKKSICVGMEVVELEWSYKGKTFYSSAIVSNKDGGVIYDNIGYLTLESVEVKSDADIIKSSIP